MLSPTLLPLDIASSASDNLSRRETTPRLKSDQETDIFARQLHQQQQRQQAQEVDSRQRRGSSGEVSHPPRESAVSEGPVQRRSVGDKAHAESLDRKPDDEGDDEAHVSTAAAGSDVVAQDSAVNAENPEEDAASLDEGLVAGTEPGISAEIQPGLWEDLSLIPAITSTETDSGTEAVSMLATEAPVLPVINTLDEMIKPVAIPDAAPVDSLWPTAVGEGESLAGAILTKAMSPGLTASGLSAESLLGEEMAGGMEVLSLSADDLQQEMAILGHQRNFKPQLYLNPAQSVPVGGVHYDMADSHLFDLPLDLVEGDLQKPQQQEIKLFTARSAESWQSIGHGLSRTEPLVNSRTEMIAPPVPSFSPDFGKRLGEQMLWFRQQHIQVAEVRLNPRELGSIHVRIDSSGDNSSVNFVAQNSHVRSVLDQNIGKLQELFADAGIQLGDVHISSGSGQERDTEMSSNHFASYGRNAALPDDESEASPVSASGMVSGGEIYLVDFFA